MLFGRRRILPFAVLSILAALLTLVAATAGLFVEDFYPVSGGLLAGAWGQDLVALLAATLILFAVPLALRDSARAVAIWSGCLGYLIYGYLLYSVDALYTSLYPLYIAILGLSVYSLIGLLSGIDAVAFRARIDDHVPIRFIALTLAIPALLLPPWLVFLLQSVIAGEPPVLNTVLVLDLSFVIPAFILTAVLVWKRRDWGFVFAGLALTKLTTMGLSLVISTFWANTAFGIAVDPFQTPIYTAFTLIGGLALALFLRHIHPAPQPQNQMRAVRA